MNSVALTAVIKLNLCRRPLMSPTIAGECLGIGRRELNALVDSGEIPWAFDLGVGRNRTELRILACCVVERATGPIPAIGATRNLNLPEVVDLILPKTRETLFGTELQRLFNASPDLIRDLAHAGEIKQLSGPLPAVGPNSSPRFTRASLVKLLENRRIT